MLCFYADAEVKLRLKFRKIPNLATSYQAAFFLLPHLRFSLVKLLSRFKVSFVVHRKANEPEKFTVIYPDKKTAKLLLNSHD